MYRPKAIIVLLFVSLFSASGFAQRTLQPANAQDTVKEFEIIKGPSMRMISTDSGNIQTIAGGAVIQQGSTRFYADSLVMYTWSHNLEAFGNIHINQADSIHTYGQYLKYLGDTKLAYIKNDVRLLGKNGTLYTKELDYNLQSGIGNFYNGGKIINDKNTVTSVNGTYYADTKDVYFKHNVKMDGPKNHIRTDSLVYNMNTASTTFITKTFIKNDDVEIVTDQGRYDTKSGDAFFTSRSVVKDTSGRIYTANNMALDGASGNAQLEGNAIIIDSSNGYTLLSNEIFLNKKNNSFLATRKPLLIIKQKHDSTYVAADTIFSGLARNVNKKLIYDSDTATRLNDQQIHKMFSLKEGDTVKYISLNQPSNYSLKLPIDSSLKTTKSTDTAFISDHLKLHKDSIPKNTPDTIPLLHDSTVSRDSSKVSATLLDSSHIQPIIDSTKNGMDSTRYFIAFHNVRIFNDSLQSVCDSMFISSADSVFRLYYDPVIWSGNTQVSGDTMFLFTKNKEPERLYVFDRSFIVSKTREGFFNQMSGKTINGYFKDGKFDYMRLKGSQAESIYYWQDDDSSYIGMNRASGDVIDIYFKNDQVRKVLFINEVKGNTYPMNAIPDDQKKLKGFEWLDNRRPKSKYELFE